MFVTEQTVVSLSDLVFFWNHFIPYVSYLHLLSIVLGVCCDNWIMSDVLVLLQKCCVETRPCLSLALCQLWQQRRKVPMLAPDQRLINRLPCCRPGLGWAGLGWAGLGTFVTGGSLLAASAAKLVWNCSAILQTAAADLLRATGRRRGRGWSDQSYCCLHTRASKEPSRRPKFYNH